MTQNDTAVSSEVINNNRNIDGILPENDTNSSPKIACERKKYTKPFSFAYADFYKKNDYLSQNLTSVCFYLEKINDTK